MCTCVTVCDHVDACMAGCARCHAGTHVCRAVCLCNHMTMQCARVCPCRRGCVDTCTHMCQHLYLSTCGHIWQSSTCGRESTGMEGLRGTAVPPRLLPAPETPKSSLFFPQENCRARGSPLAPSCPSPTVPPKCRSRMNAQIRGLGQLPHPALSMRVTTPEDQVNHFGWQVKGEETAATGQPQGRDSAPLCHCHPRHCLRPRTQRKPTGQLTSCPTG